MKKIIFILFAVMIISCNSKSDLLGTWEAVSVLDIETKEVIYAEDVEDDEDILIIEIRSDSLEYDGDFYAWEIRNDSMIINELASVLIKELTPTTLVIELDFFGDQRLTFRKIK